MTTIDAKSEDEAENTEAHMSKSAAQKQSYTFTEAKESNIFDLICSKVYLVTLCEHKYPSLEYHPEALSTETTPAFRHREASRRPVAFIGRSFGLAR